MDWPSTLPPPLLAGYSLETGDNTIRTDMDTGPARVRRRSTAAPDTVGFSVLLNAEQMVIFRAFWDTDWQSGAAWVRFQLKTGRTSGSTLLECRPVPAKWKAQPISDVHWHVSLTVEVRSA